MGGYVWNRTSDTILVYNDLFSKPGLEVGSVGTEWGLVAFYDRQNKKMVAVHVDQWNKVEGELKERIVARIEDILGVKVELP